MSDETAYPTEIDRLKALHALDLSHLPFESAFEHLTRLAARALHASIVAISVITEEGQRFRACFGIARVDAPNVFAFCAKNGDQNSPNIVSNMTLDAELTADWMIATQCVKFFASIPIRGTSGQILGMLYIFDHWSRVLAIDDMDTLVDVVTLAGREIQHRSDFVTLQPAVTRPHP